MHGRNVIRWAAVVVAVLGSPWSTARAVEPEKQPIYSNTPGGLMCGTASTNPCTIPAGRRLIIEYVSGYVFKPASANTTVSVSVVITAPQLGLNGAAFHHFVATKTHTSGNTDVFVFSAPLQMMLGPQASFYFEATSVAVSGYLVRIN